MSAVGSIAWRERGDRGAPPLLLIRPLGGSMAMWGAFADALAQRLRVVMFDARGSGESSGIPHASIRGLAADARYVLDAIAMESAHVFGISMGSMVAMRLALDAPSRVRSLVLGSTASRGLAFERAGIARALRFARCLTLAPRAAEECLVRRVLWREFRAAHPEETARFAQLAGRVPSPRTTLVAHVLAAARWNVRAELAAIQVPTLVLAGAHDHLLGVDAGLDVSRLIPRAARLVVRGAGHDLTLERPRETAAHVLELVQRVLDPRLQPRP